jgi:hypothetical protein
MSAHPLCAAHAPAGNGCLPPSIRSTDFPLVLLGYGLQDFWHTNTINMSDSLATTRSENTRAVYDCSRGAIRSIAYAIHVMKRPAKTLANQSIDAVDASIFSPTVRDTHEEASDDRF